MKPIIIYCYDAYCGWCYGFSKVIQQLEQTYNKVFDFEVLSGGMILPEEPRHIRLIAPHIESSYQDVEQLTGVQFGADYLWHIKNPEESDWFPNSEKPAIALCIFKEVYPYAAVHITADLQYALHYEGRDLTDNEAYRHLLEKYNIPADGFYQKLASEEYKDKARQEFALCRQLKVTGYPALFIQFAEGRIYALANGYTDYDTITQRLGTIVTEVKQNMQR